MKTKTIQLTRAEKYQVIIIKSLCIVFIITLGLLSIF